MGVIRKTLSISTLGLVGWRSKKERLREAETELGSARADLERTAKKKELLTEKLLDAERRAEAAELDALHDARVARRRGARRARKKARKGNGRLDSVRGVGSTVVARTREKGSRLAADLEPTVDEVMNEAKRRGREARSLAEERAAELQARSGSWRKRASKKQAKARKRATKRGAKARAQLGAKADEASAAVRKKAGQLAS